MSRWTSAEISTCSAGRATVLLLIRVCHFHRLRTLIPRHYKSKRHGPARRRAMNVLERDFFTAPEIIQDPIPYYHALLAHGPVVREPHKGVFMLSRIDEILEVYTDHERFSAIVGPLGP